MSDTYDVVSTREFAAPVEAVWRAWSDPEFVRAWWGPHGFTSPQADLDFRVGGTSLVCMRAPAEYGGQDMYNTWTYRRIEPASLLEFDLAFTDATGAPSTRLQASRPTYDTSSPSPRPRRVGRP